jgi:hypothetical protein
MKINNQYTGQTLFEQLEVGDIFIYDELVCMKVDDVTDYDDEDLNNAINLADGCHFAVSDDEEVIKVKAELTIY